MANNRLRQRRRVGRGDQITVQTIPHDLWYSPSSSPDYRDAAGRSLQKGHPQPLHKCRMNHQIEAGHDTFQVVAKTRKDNSLCNVFFLTQTFQFPPQRPFAQEQETCIGNFSQNCWGGVDQVTVAFPWNKLGDDSQHLFIRPDAEFGLKPGPVPRLLPCSDIDGAVDAAHAVRRDALFKENRTNPLRDRNDVAELSVFDPCQPTRLGVVHPAGDKRLHPVQSSRKRTPEVRAAAAVDMDDIGAMAPDEAG